MIWLLSLASQLIKTYCFDPKKILAKFQIHRWPILWGEVVMNWKKYFMMKYNRFWTHHMKDIKVIFWTGRASSQSINEDICALQAAKINWFHIYALTLFLLVFTTMIKVSRSLNKIVEPTLLPKNEQTNLFFYPDDLEILETWNQNSSFKYFWVVRIEKQIRPFVFWEKLQLANFVSRSTDL